MKKKKLYDSGKSQEPLSQRGLPVYTVVCLIAIALFPPIPKRSETEERARPHTA